MRRATSTRGVYGGLRNRRLILDEPVPEHLKRHAELVVIEELHDLRCVAGRQG